MKNLHRILRRIGSLQVADGGGAVTQPLQDSQQTFERFVIPVIAKNLFVYPLVVLVQEVPGVKPSSVSQSSNVYLNSIESEPIEYVPVQTPSLSESLSGFAVPLQPLKSPLT